MASGGVLSFTINHASQEALNRLRSLGEFAGELAEDFPYREDAKQAVEDIAWLIEHVTCERTCRTRAEA